MKKVIAIFFLFSLTASTTHFYELVKFPALIKHFIEHRAENNMGFVEFVSMHYMKGEVKDHDYMKDMKLPFKTLINNSCTTILYAPCISFVWQAPFNKKAIEPSLTRYLFQYSALFTSNIWQPPRKC